MLNKEINADIVGVDEVGYGCCAGPVFVCALRFLKKTDFIFSDSKLLSPKQRNFAFEILKDVADYSIGIGSIEEINELGLARALRLAIERAITKFSGLAIFIDGRKPAWLNCHAIVKGDQKVQQIAAASIVAKCSRDAFMLELASKFPSYGWDVNKGYSTKKHIDAITLHGLTKWHRIKYKNLAKFL